MLAMVYKQKGVVSEYDRIANPTPKWTNLIHVQISVEETRKGCAGREDFFKVTNNDAFAQKYDLELVAGSVFYTPYSKATDVEFCRVTKCTGTPFPFVIPGEWD